MSSIATFHLLATDQVIGLRGAWSGKRFEFLRKNRKDCFEYHWSGYCLVALLIYLKNEKQIDVGQSDYNFLFPAAMSNIFFLDKPLRDKYLDRFRGRLCSARELRVAASNHLAEYMGDDNPDSVKALSDGISLLKKSLESVDNRSVILVDIS